MSDTSAARPQRKPKPATLARRHVAARGPPSSPADFLIVAIGASAGGLDAFRRLIDAMPDDTGMAFILVQHLDPNHDSLLVELLASYTRMLVAQTKEGDVLQPNHIHVIAPGAYLSAKRGILHLSEPEERHGARLPFDFLLRSLAEDCAGRTVCVVLSGTGADGSEGAKALKAKGGFIIAQDPDEAEYDGMPRSVLLTGAVNLTLEVARMPAALASHDRHPGKDAKPEMSSPASQPSPAKAGNSLAAIIDLLRTRTSHDFTLYKQGTLRRRIERRIAMAAGPVHDMASYLTALKSDSSELELLAKDLLINVTSFFRDTKVFEYLAKTTIPKLVRDHAGDQPLRIWIAGCSTGEETYSLAMLLREEITASRHNVKLQIFASDVDADAVAEAREGVFPETIAGEISPERLARFFAKEQHGYKVSPELRAHVVFTVQDVLSDPPFSRIDLISCRNLLIYLGPEAQAKVISLFHFALRQGGLLLLGSSETAGHVEGRFEVISKSERLYRHVGRARPGAVGFGVGRIDGKTDGKADARTDGKGDGRAVQKLGLSLAAPSRQVALAELVRRMALKIYAPALVLINRKLECLYFLGPTNRYLHHPEGHPSNELLGMVPQDTRIKLRAAIQQVGPEHAHISMEGALADAPGGGHGYTIDVHSLMHEGEELLLVGFLDVGHQKAESCALPAKTKRNAVSENASPARITDLERELDNTRTELHAAIHNLELSSEEQKAVNEEALSVNEEFQSTNEELLTSKEELQSLNEELTALNNQLQETLDRQRTTSNDLQNVLYSTDVATLFLDVDLNIRFFTPATKALFNVIPGDVGRPLADLHSLAIDANFAKDAREVLEKLDAIDREIETRPDMWFVRRILPYRNHVELVEGVVITFTDISERKRIQKLADDAKLEAEQAKVVAEKARLEAEQAKVVADKAKLEAERAKVVADKAKLEADMAKLEAEQANRAKSRFLAAASHDLRQPLQTIAFVQGLLAKTVQGEKAQNLVKRLDDTLHAMSGMLNALLDINQIEAGVLRTDIVSYPLGDLFERLREEFSYHAKAKALVLKVVPCGQSIHTDARLLEQVLRNLLTNAIKYTRSGKVLLGCRRRAGSLSIEIWDTGIGIPDTELQTIFEEYHQLDNAARERNRGLGLGLAIVQRLVALLGYKVHVRSRLGKGSVFAIEIALPIEGIDAPAAAVLHLADQVPHPATAGKNCTILVVEDDPDVRELLALLLEAEGHNVTTAFDGLAALELVGRGTLKPDLVIADYNLPKGMDGLQVAARLRSAMMLQVPVVILTGDISTRTLTEIARNDCVHLNKPVKLKKMMSVIETLLAAPPAKPVTPPAKPPTAPAKPLMSPEKPSTSPEMIVQPGQGPATDMIYVVDDDQNICDTMRALLEGNGFSVATFPTCEAFLAHHRAGMGGCLLIDAYLPGMNGFALLQQLKDANDSLPAIMITGNSDVPMAVQAMKAGAIDFIEKPVGPADLLASITRALEQSRDVDKRVMWRDEAQSHMAGLTPRQKQVMELVLAGHPSKNIAADLGISQRTVENHRNAIMTRTGCKSLPALARLALAAMPQDEHTKSLG